MGSKWATRNWLCAVLPYKVSLHQVRCSTCPSTSCREVVTVAARSKLVPVAGAAQIHHGSKNLLRQLVSAGVDADLYGKWPIAGQFVSLSTVDAQPPACTSPAATH